MNIERRKLHLIRDLMQTKDERLIDTISALFRKVDGIGKTPHQDSITDKNLATVKKQKKKKTKPMRVISFEELENRDNGS